MLTRAMAKELSANSAHKCLFVDFLYDKEPKKVFEAFKHPRWVGAMQEELNQFAKNKVWTLVPPPYEKTIIGSKKKEKLLQLEQWAYLSTHPSKRLNSFCYDDDDDEDYTIVVTPSLSIEEPENFLSMGDEHLDTIPVTKSDEFIKSSVKNLIPIPNQFEDFSESNDEVSSIDDDSFSIDNIDYVEASPPDSELISSEVMEIVIPEISSGNPTTHSDSTLYASFIFDLSINPFPSADRSDFYEFTDELIPFISPPEYDCFLFKVEPNSRDFTKDVVEDISLNKEPQVHNALPTHPTLQLNLRFQLSSESLFTYVVWIFFPFLSDDDSLHEENIEYVEASPHDSELVSLEAAEIVIPKVEEIEDDNLREKLLNVHLLIANIEALKDNPTQSSELLTKSSSTSLNSFLKETNTFHNSFLEFENFYFDLGEISSGSTTTHSDISLPDYEAFSFDDDHVKEISSGSTTTHSDISLSEHDSFIFDLTRKEFVDELAHIISPPEYDRFYFWNLPDPGELMSVLNSGIHENLLSITRVNLPIEDDHSPLLAYVVWVFLAYLTYPVIPPYLHPFGNKDTIFDPGITINRVYSFEPIPSHRHGAFKKFNTHSSHLNEWSMIINGKNTPLLDVLLILGNLKTLAKRFYPPSLNFLSFNWESCILILSTNVLSLLHLAGSQPMLKSSYKAEASIILSIPPLVGGMADVVVEIKGT
nr:retrovirus-related Pol polyprotein from transposon TNT 1-94 [Tanacetum cinerariifolium]